MYPPNHYHSMTDEQLAQVHQLTVRCERAERNAEVNRAAAEQVQQRAEEEIARLRSELTERANLIVSLAQKLSDQKNATRRLSAAQVATLKALRALHDACTTVDCCGISDARAAGFAKAQKDAAEVLDVNDIPF